jgi:lipopolysaccharide transport system permease protein
VTPISIVISNLFSFVIQFVFFLAFFLYFYLKGSAVFLTPGLSHFHIILLMAGLGLGFGIIISSHTTKYRDLSYLVGFGVGCGCMPSVIYPVSTILNAGAGWRTSTQYPNHLRPSGQVS